MRANLPVRLLKPVLSRRPCLVTTVHSDLALDYSHPLQAAGYQFLDRWSRRRVDRLVAVSQGLADALAGQGWPRSRTAVVPSGVALWPAGESRCLDGANLPPQDGRPTVGTVARLVAVKDLELLLEAAQELRLLVPALRVVVVGDGPRRSQLEAAAGRLGLHDMIFFTGELRPAWPVLERFDAYVLTSRSEGLPVSVLEAMACGLPVVATRVGGLPELVEEGVSGFLVGREGSREETASQLAERLARLLSDEQLRRRMGAAGARRVAREFSARAAARRMLRVYERCLLERGSRRRAGGC
jgi:glycosyltransferase involved in cell wall biosynthesis